MKAVNNKILVTSDVSQKDYFLLGDISVKSPVLFDTNYRQRSPVMCQVSEATKDFPKGTILLCHHNTFYLPSPYHVYGNIFSIPCNGNVIFAKFNADGSLYPLFGNMFCRQSEIHSTFALPEKEKKYHSDRAIITEPGLCNYKKNDLVFTRPSAAYEIVYTFHGKKQGQFKVHESMVAGVLSG